MSIQRKPIEDFLKTIEHWYGKYDSLEEIRITEISENDFITIGYRKPKISTISDFLIDIAINLELICPLLSEDETKLNLFLAFIFKPNSGIIQVGMKEFKQSRIYVSGRLILKPLRYWKPYERKQPLSWLNEEFIDESNLEIVEVLDEIDYLGGKRNSIKSVRVGLFPMSCENEIRFKVTDAVNTSKDSFIGFVAHKCSESQEVFLKDVFNSIKAKKISLAVLPELSVCNGCLNKLIELISNDSDINFLVIVAGSFHVPFDSKHRNTSSIVLFVRNHFTKKMQTKKFYYHKQQPMLIKNDLSLQKVVDGYDKELHSPHSYSWLKEDIISGKKVLALNFQSHGSFGITICKDFLQEEGYLSKSCYIYNNIADHIIVLSMNPNRKGFEERAMDLRSSLSMAVFYVNSRWIESTRKESLDKRLDTFIITPNSNTEYMKNEGDLCENDCLIYEFSES